VIRQILVESSILAVIGGAIGLFLAFVTLDVFLANLPQALSPIDARIDGRVLLFTAGLIFVTSILFGLLPAREASRTDPNRWLGTVRTAGESGRSRTRGALVVFEVAVTLILVSAAALLLNSFARLQAVQMGWDEKNVVTFTVSGPPSSGARKADFMRLLLQQIQSSPGVQSAAAGGVVPLRGAKMIGPVRPDGVAGYSDKEEDLAGLNNVTPDFFRVFGIPLVAGRMFDSAVDIEGGPVVAIVNDRLARRFFNGDAIGRRIRVPGQPEGAAAEIVGVVADVRQSGPGKPIRLEMYIPAGQSAETAGYVAVRTAGDPTVFMANVRSIVRSLDNRVVVEQLVTMEQMHAQAVAEERFRTLLVSAYSALAVVLAVIGVYSVVAHSIARRRTEIGIRMALGGGNQTILRMLLWQGFTPCFIGIVLGLGGSVAVGRAMRALLFGISAEDPLTLAAAVALVAIAGLGACAVPAIQALRVDPAMTLKSRNS
jgi:putative ABC transport system permease protein